MIVNIIINVNVNLQSCIVSSFEFDDDSDLIDKSESSSSIPTVPCKRHSLSFVDNCESINALAIDKQTLKKNVFPSAHVNAAFKLPEYDSTVQCSALSKCASPPYCGKYACANVLPGPSNGSPSPCSPETNRISICTRPSCFTLKFNGVTSAQT
ncbi:hypothetical protein DERP_009872 [Dermatophagoides pteronyssinus]|uniref:Uncharacterized protein n=1 Tax=Dermatophagoides pteronyssinus TaxID=6956 RepID=A0ABQ8J1S0_DERPT|nr:hypothetical protein DERP_009872 [Dermatophagoides pteronyssinus]